MREPKLAVRGLVKTYGALRASDDLSFEVAEGEVHAVIGPNGAGKTTLVAQLSGEVRPDAGSIALDGRPITHRRAHERARLGIARTFQITTLCPDFTAEDNVALAVQANRARNFDMWRDARRDRTLREPARALLERVGLLARAGVPSRAMSHGEHRQLEIATALALEPQVLLLDEPLAGMGAEESHALVALLRGLKGSLTIVLVEHDVDAVEALADHVTVLVAGRSIASGTFADVRADPDVRRAYLGEGA